MANIQVFLRCRPSEGDENVKVLPQENVVKLNDREYKFDQVFPPDTSQELVYNSVVKPMINLVLSGFYCTVLAYGQTGTGKTYTMEGDRPSNVGIIPRAVNQLFRTLTQEGQKFNIDVSFLELYNENVYDLLSKTDDMAKLRVFDDNSKKGSVIVEGLQDVTLESEQDIYTVLERGSARRQSASTLLNACSSRSHAIFTITVRVEDQEHTKVGKLHLVDLAGSENIGRSGAQLKQAREAGNINQSLLTLTRVVTALVEKRPHIPYRESKLTRILQDSLGGATRTSMIATISTEKDDLVTTMSTLDYAIRARSIINRPESNRQRISNDLTQEIQILKDKHAQEKAELEYNIRNEVALEFRREMQKIKESFQTEIRKVAEDRDRLHENAEELTSDLKTSNEKAEQLTEELRVANEKIEQLTKELKIANELARYRQELVDRLQNDLREKIKAQTPPEESPPQQNEETDLKKAAKIRKRVPVIDEVNDYANMTFDGDDEIVQVSPTKKRKKVAAGGKKKSLYQPLTLSGKKKALRSSEDDIDISIETPPVRVTRSRAPRRKLEY